MKEPTKCPACVDKRVHTDEELNRFHPLAGHGYSPETGWTHLALGPARGGEPSAIL